MSLRRRVWEVVEVAHPGDAASRAFDITILSLILLNVVAVVIGTVESVQRSIGGFLEIFELISVVVFTVEYAARVWSCAEDGRYSDGVGGRLRFAFSGMALVDLLAILPFYVPFVGVDLRFIRAFRLLRIVRIAKVGRYYSSMTLIRTVLRSKREELTLAVAIMLLLLIVAASGIYYCEHDAQPDAFPSIPGSLWWAVVTLTTVGYGDVCPVTVGGRALASVIAVIGIGMFALPTGILGAGFVEEIEKRKTELRGKRCPYCGKELP